MYPRTTEVKSHREPHNMSPAYLALTGRNAELLADKGPVELLDLRMGMGGVSFLLGPPWHLLAGNWYLSSSS